MCVCCMCVCVCCSEAQFVAGGYNFSQVIWLLHLLYKRTLQLTFAGFLQRTEGRRLMPREIVRVCSTQGCQSHPALIFSSPCGTCIVILVCGVYTLYLSLFHSLSHCLSLTQTLTLTLALTCCLSLSLTHNPDASRLINSHERRDNPDHFDPSRFTRPQVLPPFLSPEFSFFLLRSPL